MRASTLRDTPEHRARAREAIEHRYRAPLYRERTSTDASVIVVRTFSDGETLYVVDEQRHQILSYTLASIGGGASFASLVENEDFSGMSREDREVAIPTSKLDLIHKLERAVAPEGQRILFSKLVGDIPPLVSGFFPIASQLHRLSLARVRVVPPTRDARYPRQVVEAKLVLERTSTPKELLASSVVDHGVFALFNVTEPAPSGRAAEMHTTPRAFDEIEYGVRRAIAHTLGTEIPLRLANARGMPRIGDLLADGPRHANAPP